MAYRFDSSTGTFVQTGSASPVSRRSTSPIGQRPGGSVPQATGGSVSAQTTTSVNISAQGERKAPRKNVKREKAGELTYNPATGEFSGRGTSRSSTRYVDANPPVVHRYSNRTFSSRLEWFFSRVMTRVAVYLIAGSIISMCTSLFR